MSFLIIFYCIDRWLLMILNEIQNLLSSIQKVEQGRKRNQKSQISRLKILNRTRRSCHLTHSWSLKFLTLSHNILDLKMPRFSPIHDISSIECFCSMEFHPFFFFFDSSLVPPRAYKKRKTIDLVQFSSKELYGENFDLRMATRNDFLLLFV